jgi:hypothetical protein
MKSSFPWIAAAHLLVSGPVSALADDETTVLGIPLQAQQQLPVVTTQWGDGVIFPPVFGPRLLAQCSRATLGAGSGYWLVPRADIEIVESVVAAYVNKKTTEVSVTDLQSYQRQYVGVMRANKKSIYVSFIPSAATGEEWRSVPFQQCHSGPSFFGAEVDMESQSVTHLAVDSQGPIRIETIQLPPVEAPSVR